jgi:hypothetical protein
MGNMMGVSSLKIIEILTSLFERQLCAKSKLLLEACGEEKEKCDMAK